MVIEKNYTPKFLLKKILIGTFLYVQLPILSNAYFPSMIRFFSDIVNVVLALNSLPKRSNPVNSLHVTALLYPLPFGYF